MYLAPLNYDRYFKKVFSDIEIAKQFLEDFLSVEIQEIVPMPVKHKVTDASRYVEFDFRCKIDNSYIIIDMQQWYKPDVVYRFYTYHSVNTALQLENLPEKRILLPDKEIKITKDYSSVIPVVTIIWMVNDNLGFTDDYIAYTLLPEKAKTFFENTRIWKNEEIIEHIKEINNIINNENKGLTFFSKNRLIFAFQPNIVKNKKFASYSRWFEIAQKTLNELNKKSDFDIYEKDRIMIKLMRRILLSDLQDNDIEYIKNYQEVQADIERYNIGLRNEGKIEGKIEGKEERSNEIALKMIKDGEPNERIFNYTGLSENIIDELRKLV